MHDADHSGFDNTFHVMTTSALALTYNNESVNQNHHAATAFKLLLSPGLTFFQLKDSDFRFFREMVIESILYTDLARHFELVGRLEHMR